MILAKIKFYTYQMPNFSVNCCIISVICRDSNEIRPSHKIFFLIMKLLFFGPLADIAGKTQFDLSEIQNTDELKWKIFEKHPELETHSFLIAVNKKVQRENVTLNNADEIALLPPFSGG